MSSAAPNNEMRFQQNNRRHNSSTTSNSPPISSSVHMPFNTMFHSCQESSALYNELVRRNISCYEQKRKAEYTRYHLMSGTMHHNKMPPPHLTNLPRQQLPTEIRLTMEVQSSDFASLHDGREAWGVNDSLSEIIKDTNCIVQFADQYGTLSEANGIFNQVTITGAMPNIDHAMARIRAFCPITLAIPLKELKDELHQSDLVAVIRQWCKGPELRDFPRVQFSILYPPNQFIHIQHGEVMNNLSLVVRASRKDYKMMVEACNACAKLLFKEPQGQHFYSYLKMPSSQRRMIVGSPDGVLIKTISNNTKATIHFPKSLDKKDSTNYHISGTASAVVNAVRAIQDISPVRIEFEAENDWLSHSLSKGNTDCATQREWDQFDIAKAVIVQLRKSIYEGGFRLEREGMRHSLTLMTSEENIQSLYKVRQQILVPACWKQEPPVARPQKVHKRGGEPRYLDYLRVLVMESSMRAYVGEGRVVSVCRCPRPSETPQSPLVPPPQQQQEREGMRKQPVPLNFQIRQPPPHRQHQVGLNGRGGGGGGCNNHHNNHNHHH